MRLYNSQVSGNCWKVRQILAHVGVPYEVVELSVVDRSDRPAVLGGLNPALRVPTVVLDDGRPLAESNAILTYFADDTDLIPTDRYERAQVMQWLFFEQYSHEPYIAVARFIQFYLGLPEDRLEEYKTTHKGGYKALRVMEKQLQATPYLVGDQYSIADIALYAYTHVAHEGGFDLSPYPAVQAWLARVASHPRHVPMLD